jgi:uracil-DNA glycosylase family 4
MTSKWERLLDVYDEYAEDESFVGLRNPGIRLVRGDGPGSAESARVLVIGEAPGAQENGQERPFVGASGRVLNGLLNRAGLWRQDCFVTNIVKYRPMDAGRNATPSLRAQLASMPYVRREWSIIRPRLTICVGSVAHTMIAGSQIALSNTKRGELSAMPARSVAWRTSQFHPAYGMRNPSLQPRMEEEWDRLWWAICDVGGILCDKCYGAAARESALCEGCNPEGGKQ